MCPKLGNHLILRPLLQLQDSLSLIWVLPQVPWTSWRCCQVNPQFHPNFRRWPLTSALNCTKNNVQLPSGQHSWPPGWAPTHLYSHTSHYIVIKGTRQEYTPNSSQLQGLAMLPPGLCLQIWVPDLFTVQWGRGTLGSVLWSGCSQQCLHCPILSLKTVPPTTGP